MQKNLRWGHWATLAASGLGVGWAIQCQTPSSHLQVRMGEDCVSCHQSDFQSASQPLHVGVISTACGECHSNDDWSPARGSNHSWPLSGAHAAAACNTCHLGEPPIYEGTPTACLDCHRDDREEVIEPSHADFSDECQTCHGSTAWQPAVFGHEWPLEGVHATTTCASCHTGSPPVYDGTPTACISCHEQDRASVTEPPHAGFSDACQSCHGTASWDSASFEHTTFALTGAHQTAECASCHTGTPAVFAGTARECVGCHQRDFDASPFPGHSAFAPTCQDCHTTGAWRPASGGNHPQARFSITGDHNFACGECHNPALGPNGAGNADCVGCHEGEHTLARMDGEHGGIGDYPRGANRAPNFCLQCHADGRE